MKTKILFLSAFLPVIAFGATFSGSGTGANLDDACYDAAQDVSRHAYQGVDEGHALSSYSFTKLSRRKINDKRFYACDLTIDTDQAKAPAVEQMTFVKPVGGSYESKDFSYPEASLISHAVKTCSDADQGADDGSYRFYRPIHSEFVSGSISGGVNLQRKVTCALYAVTYRVNFKLDGKSKEEACAAANTKAISDVDGKCALDSMKADPSIDLKSYDTSYDQTSGVWTCEGSATVTCYPKK